jgi:hypothetical protein
MLRALPLVMMVLMERGGRHAGARSVGIESIDDVNVI